MLLKYTVKITSGKTGHNPTPCRRVLASPHVDENTKQQLRQLYMTINPVALQHQIGANLKQLWALER